MIKPDWKDAPEWVNWLGQNSRGRWEWYADKPKQLDSMWGIGKAGGFYKIALMCDTPNPEWTETLEARP